jgi:hypothetical protein
VLNKGGMPVTDLAARDFIVREGDVEREVLRVSRATDAFQMALLVDNSTALNPYLVDVRAGLAEFIREMGGQNELALVGFGSRPTILVDYTRDVKKLSDGASRLFPETLSGGYLLDAIIEVGRGLKKREGTRRALVVIGTTVGQEFSERYHRYVLDELRDSGALRRNDWSGKPADRRQRAGAEPDARPGCGDDGRAAGGFADFVESARKNA